MGFLLSRYFRPRKTAVWLAFQDDNEVEELIGVFRTQEEASKFADKVEHEYENGVLYRSYRFGWTGATSGQSRYWTFSKPDEA
ncbi:hypothetical protein [Leucobacter sp. NPDC077196]|uniref:hypothetical protein n=1 Tax=Leucobacter sp. NPDC077196 TaxID=3154959 RepID=UPI00343FD3EA